MSKLPSIPSIRNLPADIAKILTPIKTILENLTGARGQDDAAVTYGQLAAAVARAPVPSTADPLLDSTPLSAPTGFVVKGAIQNILMSWDSVAGYARYAYTEIRRATGVNDIAHASSALIGTTYASVYADDDVTDGVYYYYWIRHVNYAGIPGPWHAGGTSGEQGGLGVLNLSDFSQSVIPVEILASLPATGNFEGRQVVLTSNGRLYTYRKSTWTDAVLSAMGGVPTWTSQLKVDVSADNTTVNKNEAGFAWDAQAVAEDPVPAGDCELRATVSGIDGYRVLALGTDPQAAFSSTWEFAIYVQEPAATLYYVIFEAGAFPLVDVPTLVNTGDVVAIRVRNGVVEYTVNGNVIHTSGTAPTFPLKGAAIFHSGFTEWSGLYWSGALGNSLMSVAPGTIGAEQLVANSVVAGKIAAGAVRAGEIATDAIVAGDGVIGDLAVDTAQIADAAIVEAKLGDAEVTNAKIGNLIQSTTFDAATGTGWRVQKNGLAEFNEVIIRDRNGDTILHSGIGNNDLAHMFRNRMIDPSLWVYATQGDQPGFSVNGIAADNTIVSGTGPFNPDTVLWQSLRHPTQYGQNGWITDSVRVDPWKTYRFSTWINWSLDDTLIPGAVPLVGVESPTPGVTLLEEILTGDAGPGGVLDAAWLLNATFQTLENTYGLTAGTWYLAVGYVFGLNKPDGAGGIGGIYDPATGERVLTFSSDYRWANSSVTGVRFKTALYDAAGDVNAKMWFFDPRIDLLDAHAPTVLQLLDAPTVGATWDSNIAGQPADEFIMNDQQTWGDIVAGGGKPADNATVGADWATNLASIPTTKVYNADSASQLGFNPAFGNFLTNAPFGWTNWSGGATEDTVNVMTGDSAVKYTTNGVSQYGMTRTSAFPALPLGSYVTGSVTYYVSSVTAAGSASGILVDCFDDQGGFRRTHVQFTDMAVGWHTVGFVAGPRKGGGNRKLNAIRIYAMASYNASVPGPDTDSNYGTWGGTPFNGVITFDSIQFSLQRTIWEDIDGDGKPEDYATLGAAFDTGSGGNITGKITPTNVSTYIDNVAIKTAQIADANITTLKIQGDAVTVPNSASVTTQTTVHQYVNSDTPPPTWYDILSFTIDVGASGVAANRIFASALVKVTPQDNGGTWIVSNFRGDFRIYVTSDTYSSVAYETPTNTSRSTIGDGWVPITLMHSLANIWTGNVTIKLQGRLQFVGNDQPNISLLADVGCTLYAIGTKK